MKQSDALSRCTLSYLTSVDGPNLRRCSADGVLPWNGNTFLGGGERRSSRGGCQGRNQRPPHRIKHFVYAPVIEIDGNDARAWSDVIVSLVPKEGSAEMSFVGRYHDHLRREKWMLATAQAHHGENRRRPARR